jgi:hypothetical protein
VATGACCCARTTRGPVSDTITEQTINVRETRFTDLYS